MNITIKDVPEEIAEEIKERAVSIIEEYKRAKLTTPKEVIDAFKEEVDTIRVANGLSEKYFPAEAVVEEPISEEAVVEEPISEEVAK